LNTEENIVETPSIILMVNLSWQDKKGNPPGIIRTIVSDPMPDLFKTMIKRLVRWQVLPATCVPDSCIVNIYEPGDCIPPHIDSHDFVRPFCTVSFLSECNILFGPNLKVAAPGEFIGSIAIPLPVGYIFCHVLFICI
jgi:mRNA N6-methyladenine demethylase